MKMLEKSFIVLAALAALGVFFFLTLSETQAQEGKVAFTLSEGIGTGKVLGIHSISLKKGVEPNEFEKFVVEEWAPVLQDLFPGWKALIMKGERGSRINQYILVYDISSLYARDFYVPKPWESSEMAKKIIQDCGDKCKKLVDRFEQMIERTEWTDYVALTKK